MEILLKWVLPNMIILISWAANTLLNNIMFYEITENKKFPWGEMVHNPIFWIITGIGFVYNFFMIYTTKSQKETSIIKQEVLDGKYELLLDIAIEHAKENEMSAAKEMVDFIRYIDKETKK